LRVISGVCKGRRLFSLKGLALRPTSDRVKEAIFDRLQDRVQGRRILDLFAGTGALGIEALSRGANFTVFVEAHGASRAVIQKNLTLCGFRDRAEILPLDVAGAIQLLERRQEIFDLIFLDPPYNQGYAVRVLKTLAKSHLLAPQGLIIAEHSAEEPLDQFSAFFSMDQRQYGRTRVSFFHRPEKDL